ncbi:hypothetical protein ASPWEDRAFT_166635 [Aspergillus wentii DTO 134E9]|uniref:F-box domain-containing protein n=1 Tax=Aspergillus wentii DTO 134E9 TaxID=1073089 RepID=A0A1L9S075_ASPWE|nr:uncharacterized protein ASPWEDRAFT_166635 [Aspergillus wentii DTO 134E9]KAI9932983.1 hypothetical protein MW887_009237 [Aspergillus wentii]OJJ40570.1 hypothetical protein ASPWEDRAFT_166635 [Aspergillus wentii DTO 134E9]
MSAESPGQRTGFRAFFSNALRPKKSRQVLRKANPSTPDLRQTALADAGHDPLPSLAPLQAHKEKYKQMHAQVDSQLGENRDYTSIIHTLGILDNGGNDSNALDGVIDHRPPGEPVVASLSSELWDLVAEHLNPADVASLAFASKTLRLRLGPGPWLALRYPENREYRIDFLVHQDRYLPYHLLCFPCAKYHRRTRVGSERLQPADVVNPLFDCPNIRNPQLPPPRHRITHGRVLPFTFVQLVTRARRFAPFYGIPPEFLSRRWRRDGWLHQSRYLIEKGRLLMRVVSQCFAPPDLPPSSQRMLLYSREDYWPYFSACAHWRDGELMDVCKCALGHIPKPRATAGLQGLEHRAKDICAGRSYDPNSIASLCGKCRPMRRCPECPTEYLVEVKLTEDRNNPRDIHFKHAITVTRWSDLGDGTSPKNLQWAACNGQREYDSFQQIGKRAISSIFESAFTADTLPGQRIISMNPKGKKLGEEGTGWY